MGYTINKLIGQLTVLPFTNRDYILSAKVYINATPQVLWYSPKFHGSCATVERQKDLDVMNSGVSLGAALHKEKNGIHQRTSARGLQENFMVRFLLAGRAANSPFFSFFSKC